MMGPNTGLNKTTWERMFIMLKDPSNTEHIKKVLKDLKRTFNTE